MSEYSVKDLQDNLDYLNETKGMIKQAIINKGQEIYSSTPFRDYVDKIEAIETGVDTSDATAKPEDILMPRTAYVNGQKLTGAIRTVTEPADFSLDMGNFSTTWSMYDYRPDIGYALAWRNDKVIVLKIGENNTFTQVAEIASGWQGTMSDFVFGLSPMLETEEQKLYNIYITGVEFSSGSNWYHSIYVVRFNVLTDSIVDNPAPYLFREVSFQPHYYGGSTFYNYILPINENRILLLQRNSGNGGDTGIVANMTPAIYLLGDNSGSKVGTVPMVDTAYQNRGFGCISTTHNIYICYTTSKWAIYLINSTKSGATQLATSTVSTWNPCLIGDFYLYDNKLYNTSNQVVKDYGDLFEASTWKFYINGFVIEVIDSNVKIYNYDSTTKNITFNRIVTGMNISVPSYGSAVISAFPRFTDNRLTAYSNSDVVFKTFDSVPATESIVEIIRGQDVYTSANGLTLMDSSKLLTGQVAQGVSGKITGSMPNNGTLTYTPSKVQQTIPAGYTSGGTIAAALIENSTEYDACLGITEDILGTGV